MRTRLFLLVVNISIILIVFSNANAQTNDEDLTNLKYFKIYVTTSDDSLFLKVQNGLSIEPIVESYLLIVNITSNNKDEQYIVFGDEKAPSSLRMGWYNLSNEVRDGLIAWSKPNKMKAEALNKDTIIK